MGVSGIIYCLYLEDGKQQLEKLIEDYQKVNLPVIYRNNLTVIFLNQDRWDVVKANDNARGRSCNIAYIENGIDEDTVIDILEPTVRELPYQAIKYFSIL